LFLVAFIFFLVLFLLPSLLQANLWPPEIDWFILIFMALTLFMFVLKVIAPRLAYVQCTSSHVRIQTPFYPFVISYRRIVEARPNQWGQLYPAERMTRRRRRVIGKALGEEVIVLDLKGWPVSRNWLKLWVPDVMFLPGHDGLILWVADWMSFNRELSDFKDRWRQAHSDSKPALSVYSRMKQQ
jgi:hypothetical protein